MSDWDKDSLLQVLKDLEPFLENLVLIGGWLPWIYREFLWKLPSPLPIIKTLDIDFAVREHHPYKGETIRHRMERSIQYIKEPVHDLEPEPFNFIFQTGKKGGVPYRIDFLSHEYQDPARILKLLGEGMYLPTFETVELMLDRANQIRVSIPLKNRTIPLIIPRPSVYFFVKGSTFAGRSRTQPEEEHKFYKDMWSLFYVWQSLPEKEKVDFLGELKKLQSHKDYASVFQDNLGTYFKDKDSEGPKGIATLLPGFPEHLIQSQVMEMISDLMMHLGWAN